jgi:hypothetical protein
MLQFVSSYLDLAAWLGVGTGHCFGLGTQSSYSICVKIEVTKGVVDMVH